jgi:hypothetical protein
MKQNMFKLTGVALLLALLVALIVAPASAQGPDEPGDVGSQAAGFTAIAWNPTVMQVPINGATAVNRIQVNGASQIFAFTLEVGYDADRVTPDLANVLPGGLLPGTRGVDYFFSVSPTASAPCVPVGAVVPAGFRVIVGYVPGAGPVEGSGPLVEIPWKAHNGPASGICIAPTSQVVDQVGLGTSIPLTNGTLTVVAPSNRFRIGLQGGKPSGLTAANVPAVNVINVTVNGLPCPVIANSCNPFDGAPYDVKVIRPGYLDVAVNFATNSDVRSIYMLAGDLNSDKTINLLDLVQMAALLGNTFVYNGLQSPALERADFVTNGTINIADLVFVARNFGKTGPTDGTPPPGDTDF